MRALYFALYVLVALMGGLCGALFIVSTGMMVIAPLTEMKLPAPWFYALPMVTFAGVAMCTSIGHVLLRAMSGGKAS